jgi:hypothetical protein
MMLAILAYSTMTGLSAFAWDWVLFTALHFLVGVAIGSEWVTGHRSCRSCGRTGHEGAASG